MTAALIWLRARADNVAVGLLAAMFVAFILQIFFRYIVNQPLSWTLEACLLTWLWLVFWGAAFQLRDKDNVRFDILYSAAGPGGRRVFGIISAVAIVIGFVSASPATYDFVSFMAIESSSSLGIRLDWVFAVYLIFMGGVIVRYTWRTVALIRGPLDEFDTPTDVTPPDPKP